MADPVSRGAARWATLTAVPLALLAGVGAFAALGGFDGADPGGRPGAGASASPPAPTGPTPTGPVATGPVEMSAPALSGRAELVCRALLSRLPDSLRDQARRPVTAGAEQNAAYGEPPITVACGAAAATFPATDVVYALSGVCWHAAQGDANSVWTTVDREVPIRVTLPAAYQGQLVIDLSAAIVGAVPPLSAEKIPTGCNP